MLYGYFCMLLRLVHANPDCAALAKLLGANTVQVGVINSTFLLVAGAFSLPLGLVSDRIGRKLPHSLRLCHDWRNFAFA